MHIRSRARSVEARASTYEGIPGSGDLGRYKQLGGGFKYFLFSPLPREMIQFDYYFSNGFKPLTSIPSRELL